MEYSKKKSLNDRKTVKQLSLCMYASMKLGESSYNTFLSQKKLYCNGNFNLLNAFTVTASCYRFTIQFQLRTNFGLLRCNP